MKKYKRPQNQKRIPEMQDPQKATNINMAKNNIPIVQALLANSEQAKLHKISLKKLTKGNFRLTITLNGKKYGTLHALAFLEDKIRSTIITLAQNNLL